MALLYRNVRRKLSEPEHQFLARFRRHLLSHGCSPHWIRPVRRSIDARAGRPVTFNYHLAFEAADEQRLRDRLGAAVESFQEEDDPLPACGTESLPGRIVVVGTGPAGLYAGYLLAQAGFSPLVCDKGLALRDRVKAVRRFFRTGVISPEGNVLFGEGGAGTYSDGKLLTRVNKPGIRSFYRLLVACGAPQEILIDAQPHVGTDRLRLVVLRLHETIEALGGEFRFRCALSGLRAREGRLVAARLGGEWEEVGALVLAAGQHDDTVYRVVHEAGARIEARPYQLGLRIEHPQDWVNRWRYGQFCGHPELPPASYRVTWRGGTRTPGQSVTTFCMCPGGELLPLAPCEGRLGTNGMSRAARAGAFANSAVITTVPVATASAWTTLRFRDRLERAAYLLGGGSWKAPAQRAPDFLNDRISADLPETSYRLGLKSADICRLFTDDVAKTLRGAIAAFDRIAPGFAGRDGLVIAPESRVSSPVRILRDPTGEAMGLSGLYPCGEGSGYASGITSSALDGRRSASSIIGRFKP